MIARFEDLLALPCVAHRPGSPALDAAAVAERLAALGHGWAAEDGRLTRRYPHPDFAAALAHANRLGALADAVDHHPDLLVRWGSLTVTVWTHTAAGLTDTDFAWAARAEGLAAG